MMHKELYLTIFNKINSTFNKINYTFRDSRSFLQENKEEIQRPNASGTSSSHLERIKAPAPGETFSYIWRLKACAN